MPDEQPSRDPADLPVDVPGDVPADVPADVTVEVVVGRIGKPHGLRGEVSVEVRTDEPERRFATGSVLGAELPRGAASTLTSTLASPLKSLEVVGARRHQTTLLVRFAELADRTAAEAARGTMLIAELPADASPEDPDEFYDHQLVGLDVVDREGQIIGEVTGVVHGAQDLLEVRACDGRPTLVPFVQALVPEVDLPAGRVVVADRPGLVAPFEEE